MPDFRFLSDDSDDGTIRINTSAQRRAPPKKRKPSYAVGCLAWTMLIGSCGYFVSTIKPTAPPAAKWYEGGTLHNASALEWQRASQEDRLATCADFVVKAHTAGLLTRQVSQNIGTVDDARSYAVELRDCLNNAFQPEPNAARNAQIFTNQKVAEGATACMILMGWTKK